MFLNQNTCGWSQSSFIFMQTLRRCRCCRSFSMSCATIETKNKFCLRTFRHSCTYFMKLYNYHAYFATSSSTWNIWKQFMFFVPICLITINLSKYHSKSLKISLSIYHIKLIGHITSMIRDTRIFKQWKQLIEIL